jgi:G6PDH family F420-dependent oxidoreductase
MRFGYFLSCEEHAPATLVDQARRAEEAGFEALWISDHFHPWNDEQGQSPFVWSVIGALSQVTALPVMTAVTCPTIRMHPVIVAHAAATAALMCPGGFRLGVGSGEALNEHVTGARWPAAYLRLEMLEEAVDVMRRLFAGERVYHRGRHYVVEDAELFTRPETPPEIHMSAFGPAALRVAARIADGFVTTQPAADALAGYREQGGKGPALAGAKCTYGADRDECVRTAHRLWPNVGLPGELAQVLPSVRHFEQASELVTPDMLADSMPCGPDVGEHVGKLAAYVDAGYDELFISQVGPDYDEFFRAYGDEVLPELRKRAVAD